MAVDIEALGLPFIPSADTGLYELPDDQGERIGRYVRALFEAKNAGVVGDAVRHPRAFVDKVVKQRVADATIGGKAWKDRCTEMDRDEQAWATRIADHNLRRVGRGLSPTGDTGGEAALAIAHRSQILDAATLRRLEERDLEIIERDERRTEDLTLHRIDPTMASIRARAFRRLRSASPAYGRARALFVDLPAGAQEAAIALSVWDELDPAERAILYGPWAEIVDGDPAVAEEAWTESADRARSRWADLPAEAHGWYVGKEDDTF